MSATSILHLTSFESPLGLQMAMRMRYNLWERFNGVSWTALPGVVPGLANQRLYSTAFKGNLIVANGSSRLLRWDGGIGGVEELSPEAPKAHFVTRIGNRLFVAKLRLDSLVDANPDAVAWSAEDDIEEWTDALAGAGTGILAPEGSGQGSNHLSGLSTIERGVLLYRERSLVLGSRTGIRAAPFRFATIDTAHGTRSPYSIANGGLAFGDFFLGFDYVVYHFDGQSPPTPIGLPIQPRLQETITDLAHCVGFIDPLGMEFWLLVPTEAAETPILSEAYIFNIKDYLRKQKLVWRFKDLTECIGAVAPDDVITTGAFVQKVPTNEVLVVDEYDDPVDDIVDDHDELVDSFVQGTSDRILFGTDDGDTFEVDSGTLQQRGYWLSKVYATDHDEITVDRVRVVASALTVAYIGVSITWDGGETFSPEIPIRINRAKKGVFSSSGWQPTTGHTFQVFIRMISGNPTVHELNILAQPRGRAS